MAAHVDWMQKLPQSLDTESVDSHAYTHYTEPTTNSSCKQRRTNATDSATDTHCTSTANRTDKAARLSPLVKSTATDTPVDTDNISANVFTPVDLDIGMDKVVVVTPPEMSSQSAGAMADMEAAAPHSATKPLPLLANRPQRHQRHPARLLSNVQLRWSLIGRIGSAPTFFVSEVGCCRLVDVCGESVVGVEKTCLLHAKVDESCRKLAEMPHRCRNVREVVV